MFAAVDLGVRSPCFFCVAALSLDGIGRIEPALQVTAAELALIVLLVAGALPNFLDLDSMMRKLRWSLDVRSGDFASRQ